MMKLNTKFVLLVREVFHLLFLTEQNPIGDTFSSDSARLYVYKEAFQDESILVSRHTILS
jgi:hypothetical protein